jgi:hypothetical protein
MLGSSQDIYHPPWALDITISMQAGQQQAEQ